MEIQNKFEDYKNIRMMLIDDLSTDPERFSEDIYTKSNKILYSPYIPIDDCLYTDKNSDLDLVPLSGNTGKVGVPLILRSNGETYIVKKSPINTLHATYQSIPPTSVKKLDKYKTKLRECNFLDINILKYIACDEFTNETIIAYIIDFILGQLGLKNYLKHYLGYICFGFGYNLMEFANLGTLDKISNWTNCKKIAPIFTENGVEIKEILTEECLLQIFYQVIITLHILQSTVNFTAGDCKSANIFVSSEPAQFDYGGLQVNSEFTCKIGDYGKSSITFNSIRIYNSKSIANKYLKISPFIPQIFTSEGENYYVISGNATTLLTRIRHMGIPFYLSYDTYTFIYSMMMNPIIYYTILGNNKLKFSLWDSLWFNDDVELMTKKVTNRLGEHVSYGNIIRDLMGVKLKCNVTNVIFELLKAIQISETIHSHFLTQNEF